MSVCLYPYLSYLARKSHCFCAVFCCHLCTAWLYCVFLLHLIQGKILGEKVIQYKVCVLIFPYSFFRSHYKKHLARECYKCTQVFM